MNREEFPLFLVGASAGGLEPLIEIVKGLHFEKPKAMIVAQHLSPTANSMLVDILRRGAKGKVKFAEDREKILSGVIYIIPPDTNAVVENAEIRLEPAPAEQISPKPNIDRLFSSVAAGNDKNKVGIILSGTGSDGSKGLEQICRAGGAAVVQDPHTAKFDAMPLAAIQQIGAPLVLSPAEIAIFINDYPDSLGAFRAGGSAALPAELPADPFRRLLYLFLVRTGVDLSAYKQATIERRLDKIKTELGWNDLSELCAAMDRDPKLLERTLDDLLIPVTSFFRDEDAFEQLKKAISQYLQHALSGPEFRVWDVGCSTGQETYSLLILLLETFRELGIQKSLRIFATDLSERSLAAARIGFFAEAELEGFDPVLLRKYFVPAKNGYQIKQAYRDLIVFSRHDVLKSPPLSRMDFVCCRNLLIYFDDSHQEKVLNTFATSLHPEAILFLGKSESLREVSDRFQAIDTKWKIYARGKGGNWPIGKPLPSRAGFAGFDRWSRAPIREAKTETLEQLGRRYLVRAHAPPSVIFDRQWKIHFLFGDFDQILRFREGSMEQELLTLLPDELRTSFLFLTAKAEKEPQTAQGPSEQVIVSTDGAKRYAVRVMDLAKMGREGFFIGSVEEMEEAKAKGRPEVATLSSTQVERQYLLLERELQETREYLQTVVEELEASNEEMQALNEELQASNEELQATNEELESTNEELQASNEELTNVNSELAEKTRQLEQTAAELSSIQNSTGYPIAVIDRNLQIVTRNRIFDEFFPGFRIKALDSILDGFGPSFRDEVLRAQGQVFAGALADFEVKINQQFFSIRLSPFFRKEDAIDGIVVSFVDQTQLITIRNRLLESDAKLSALINNSPALISIKDISGSYVLVNGAFETYFDVNKEAISGLTDASFLPKSVADRVRSVEYRVIQERARVSGEESFPTKLGKRDFLVNRFVIADQRNMVQGVGAIALDISESIANKLLVDRQQHDLDRLTQLASMGQFSASVAHEVNNPLAILASEMKLLERLIQKGNVPAERLGLFLQKGTKALERIDATITSLRKFTRDFRSVELKPVKVKDIVVEAFKPNESYFRTHDVKFEDLTSDKLVVNADFMGLSLVFSNLFRNAIEATRKNPPAWVKVWAAPGTAGNVEIFVQDSGLGVPKEVQEKLFENVYSSKGGANMGVGLKLTHQIVAVQGGRLRIEPSYKNTTFVIELRGALE